eukprot:TRINITY_DN5979_c0_g1_i2.p1 TRINITY_DN5979_c0_g1~~TRINITY_DN5979_c0_g1_i2.p1  ORF type:complete len:396 (-),score=69.58 TRINITY_DN5979_c0_g1_i2:625-1812(-)
MRRTSVYLVAFILCGWLYFSHAKQSFIQKINKEYETSHYAIEGEYSIWWKINNTVNDFTIQFALVATGTEGYVALGMSDDGLMVGASVIIGNILTTDSNVSSYSIGEYQVTEKEVWGLHPREEVGGFVHLRSGECSHIDNFTLCEFVWVPTNYIDDANHVLWSISKSGNNLKYHGKEYRGNFTMIPSDNATKSWYPCEGNCYQGTCIDEFTCECHKNYKGPKCESTDTLYPEDVSFYRNQINIELDNDFDGICTLYWNYYENLLDVAIRVTNHDGYVSVGFPNPKFRKNHQGYMIGSDVVVGWGYDGYMEINAYTMKNNKIGVPEAISSKEFKVFHRSFVYNEGNITMKFKRTFDTGTHKIIQRINNRVIVAIGPTPINGTISKHTHRVVTPPVC